MTLNSSGAISLGGTTAGVSIENELGGSGTTQISLNDTNVRTLAGVASGQISMPTNFWGKSNATYFIALIQNTSGNNAVNCGHQVNGSTITLVTSDGNTGANYLYRISASGSLTSQTKLTANGNTFIPNASIGAPNAFALDSSNNMYVDTSSSNLSGNSGFATISSSNIVNYVATLTSGSYNTVFQFGSVVYYNSSAYIPMFGYQGSCCCSTYNSIYSFSYSGTISGIYLLTNEGTQGRMSVDSSGNLFYLDQNGGVTKFTSTSTSAWGRYQISTSQGIASAINSNGTIYATIANNTPTIGMWNLTSTTNSVPPTNIVTYNLQANSDGTYNAGNSSVAFDSSNNCYFVIENLASSKNGFTIFKFNSSGTLQWVRKFVCSLSGSNNNVYNLALTVTGSYIDVSVTQLYSVYSTSFIRYPTDGSKTGTYTAGTLTIVVSAGTAQVNTSTTINFTTHSTVISVGSGTLNRSVKTSASSASSTTVTFTTI